MTDRPRGLEEQQRVFGKGWDVKYEQSASLESSAGSRKQKVSEQKQELWRALKSLSMTHSVIEDRELWHFYLK